MRKAIVLAFLLTATVHADVAELRRYVTTLASQRFGGRQTGTEGERLAREFLTLRVSDFFSAIFMRLSQAIDLILPCASIGGFCRPDQQLKGHLRPFA